MQDDKGKTVNMKKILVIEDDVDLRTNLKELLEAEGFNVMTANDGLDGYNLVLKNQFDLIISKFKYSI